jgi:hypothetical protein
MIYAEVAEGTGSPVTPAPQVIIMLAETEIYNGKILNVQ